MTIHALWNVYREGHNLPRSIANVREIFGDITCTFVDGRYPDFPDGPPLSDDDTHSIATEHGVLLTCDDYECEKRTFGLRYIDTIAKEGDWVLNLDADETITERFAWPTGKVGAFTFTRLSDGREYGRNRLYRWEPGLHFKGRHYDLYDANDELFATLEAPPGELIGSGIHYDESHDSVRMMHKRAYYEKLREREGSPWLQPTP